MEPYGIRTLNKVHPLISENLICSVSPGSLDLQENDLESVCWTSGAGVRTGVHELGYGD